MCTKCNRSVDSFRIETPVDVANYGFGYARLEHTGEIIVTVECHGEIYRQSLIMTKV